MITNIPVGTFNKIVRDLRSQGWRKTEEYDALGTWINHNVILLERDGTTLRFDWDHRREGKLDGPEPVVQQLRHEYCLR